MRNTTTITTFPSRLSLAAALMPEDGERPQSVRFVLADNKVMTCFVFNIDTRNGRLLVRGQYQDGAGRLVGEYEASLTPMSFEFK